MNHCWRKEVKRIRAMWRRNWGGGVQAVMMKAASFHFISSFNVSEWIYETAKGGSLNTNNLSSAVVVVNKGENFVHIHLFSLINARCRFFRRTFRRAEILWAHKHSLLELLCFYLVLGWMSVLYFKTMTYSLTRFGEIERNSEEYPNTYLVILVITFCLYAHSLFTKYINPFLQYCVYWTKICHMNKYVYETIRYTE